MKHVLLFIVCLACQPADPAGEPVGGADAGAVNAAAPPSPFAYVDPAGRTIATRFPTPPGFRRVELDPLGFGHFLRHQPLRPAGRKVLLYDGREKRNQAAHAAVLDVDVGKRDLQQCADAIIRLRAEYLYARERYTDLHFDFTNGFRADYARWRAGDRIRVSGNRVSWAPGNGTTAGYAAFRKYLTMVFSYAGTASLARELRPRSLEDIAVGDVFIRGGHPGHAVVVVDKVVHSRTGAAEVLLAQSYMPAQDIHVLANPQRAGSNPWYAVADMREVVRTAEYTFRPEELRAFAGE